MEKKDIPKLHSLIKGTRIRKISVEFEQEKIVIEQKDDRHLYADNTSDTTGKPQQVYIVSDQVGYFGFKKKEWNIGDMLEEKDVIGIVDTLGTKNNILAKKTGRIIEILVKEGTPVEYGQPLLEIR